MPTGAEYLAEWLESVKVPYTFGVVGIPITPVAEALVAIGIPFVGFRNEQAAGYAASVVAFINGNSNPGVLLTTSGPGFIHALPGIVNARENGWPLLVIVATPYDGPDELSAHTTKRYFQEYPHHELLPSDIKFDSFNTLSVGLVERLASLWAYTRPSLDRPAGISVLQISGAWIDGIVKESFCQKLPILTPSIPCLGDISTAISWIGQARYPLIVFGNGAVFECLDELALKLVEFLDIPFITMPMAKGLLSEVHKNSAVAARSLAIKKADLIIVIGAQSNWMLPLYEMLNARKELRLIKLDAYKEDQTSSPFVDRVVTMVGELRKVVQNFLNLPKIQSSVRDDWMRELDNQKALNTERVERLTLRITTPLEYYTVYGVLKTYLTFDTTLITEGSNTMDIARIVLQSNRPRYRLDAGTFAAMGVGMPYAIASALERPSQPIFYVAGDSAFGFSLAEVETAVRLRLYNICIIVMNNSGIYSGIEPEEYLNAPCSSSTKGGIPLLPPTALTPSTRYDHLASMFPSGARGVNVENINDLHDALCNREPSCLYILNVKLASRSPKYARHTLSHSVVL